MINEVRQNDAEKLKVKSVTDKTNATPSSFTANAGEYVLVSAANPNRKRIVINAYDVQATAVGYIVFGTNNVTKTMYSFNTTSVSSNRTFNIDYYTGAIYLYAINAAVTINVVEIV